MRETPKDLERSTKFLEYLAVFLVVCLLSFPWAELWAIPIGVAVTVATIKLWAGKAPGYLQEKMHKYFGLAGLLPRWLKRLEK